MSFRVNFSELRRLKVPIKVGMRFETNLFDIRTGRYLIVAIDSPFAVIERVEWVEPDVSS